MQDLRIGRNVLVQAVALVGYGHTEETHNERRLEWWPCEPFMAVVVGQAVKHIGTYIPGSNGYGDYEPASLAVGGTVTLWEVRNAMQNKVVLVRDEDLEPTPIPFEPPMRTTKPFIHPAMYPQT